MPSQFNTLHALAALCTIFYGVAVTAMGFFYGQGVTIMFGVVGGLLVAFSWVWAIMRTTAHRKAAEEAELQRYQQQPPQPGP